LSNLLEQLTLNIDHWSLTEGAKAKDPFEEFNDQCSMSNAQ